MTANYVTFDHESSHLISAALHGLSRANDFELTAPERDERAEQLAEVFTSGVRAFGSVTVGSDDVTLRDVFRIEAALSRERIMARDDGREHMAERYQELKDELRPLKL